MHTVLGQILLVHRRDLQFASGAGLDVFGDFHHIVGIEIQAGHGIVALGMLGFLFQTGRFALVVKGDHSEAVGVLHGISPQRAHVFLLGSLDGVEQHLAETLAVKDVVAQNEAHTVLANKFLTDNECLCQSFGSGLFGILKPHADVPAVAQQPAKHRQVLRGRDDENLTDSRQHEHRDGVIHHRFVVNGYQLLGDTFGHGIKPCARASCQYNSFHIVIVFLIVLVGFNLRSYKLFLNTPSNPSKRSSKCFELCLGSWRRFSCLQADIGRLRIVS